MKRLISLLLCFMMVFSMMPTVIAVPVMDSVESAEVEPADVPEETEAEQEVALAADPVYATKPAQYDAEKGILVLFDNGNAADAVNLTNATLDGLQKQKFNAPESPEDPVDGYYVQNMMVDLPYQTDGTYQLVGLYTGNANTTIGYADKAMNGTLGFYVDYYSSDKAANGKNMCRAIAAGTLPAQPWGVAPKSNARNFGYVYSDRNNDIAIGAGWQTPKNEIKVFDTLNFVGLVFAEGPAQYGKISRTYAYFMPTNNVKLYEGDTLIEIKDLGEATEWTVVAPENDEYSAWIDEEGKYYAENDTVAAGAVLTTTIYAVPTGEVTYFGVGSENVPIEGESDEYSVRTDNYPEWDTSIDGTKRECIGWAETENSDTAVQTVTLTKDGITLYPVWQKKENI